VQLVDYLPDEQARGLVKPAARKIASAHVSGDEKREVLLGDGFLSPTRAVDLMNGAKDQRSTSVPLLPVDGGSAMKSKWDFKGCVV
jgi:hypothetical protein